MELKPRLKVKDSAALQALIVLDLPRQMHHRFSVETKLQQVEASLVAQLVATALLWVFKALGPNCQL